MQSPPRTSLALDAGGEQGGEAVQGGVVGEGGRLRQRLQGGDVAVGRGQPDRAVHAPVIPSLRSPLLDPVVEEEEGDQQGLAEEHAEADPIEGQRCDQIHHAGLYTRHSSSQLDTVVTACVC